jgi:hypothetical protein
MAEHLAGCPIATAAQRPGRVCRRNAVHLGQQIVDAGEPQRSKVSDFARVDCRHGTGSFMGHRTRHGDERCGDPRRYTEPSPSGGANAMNSSLPFQSRLAAPCIVACALLSIIGCASSKPASAPAAAPTYSKSANGTMVPVTITDSRIIMPTTFPSGQTLFQITNNSKHQRDLQITGDGVDTSLLYPLNPGDSGEMAANLHPGKYKATCLDGSHGSAGVSFSFTVTR